MGFGDFWQRAEVRAMSESKWCDKCEGHAIGECPCVQWLVYDVSEYATRADAHEGLSPVHARDAEDAAERWAKLSECDGDYSIAEGETPTVCVVQCDIPGAVPDYFVIAGEFEVVYSVAQATPPDPAWRRS